MQENIFESIGVKDMELGVEMHRALKLMPHDFRDPVKLQALSDIAEYFSGVPDSAYVLRKVVSKNRSRGYDNLDHLHSYVSLAKERMSHQAKLEDIEKQLKFYE